MTERLFKKIANNTINVNEIEAKYILLPNKPKQLVDVTERHYIFKSLGMKLIVSRKLIDKVNNLREVD